MRTRAAVAMEAGKPLEIMEVNLEGPKAGEVLVEIKATGICHTDEFTLSGADPEGMFPAILGHEGAGVVVEVGPGVTSLQPGDHVIPLYTPECRECEYCLNPKTNLCQKIRSTQGAGVMPDGTSRFSMLDGTPILHYMGCSTFANHTVLPEIALAKVRKDAPFDKICYIGCGVTTGIGAVINTAKVEIGSRAIVFGLGGIGLNVIQGLRLAGADQIVGVDLNPGKVEMATHFGMTDFVNPSEVEGDIVSHLVELTGGGGDYTFDATGNVSVMRQALESAHKGWGESDDDLGGNNDNPFIAYSKVAALLSCACATGLMGVLGVCGGVLTGVLATSNNDVVSPMLPPPPPPPPASLALPMLPK